MFLDVNNSRINKFKNTNLYVSSYLFTSKTLYISSKLKSCKFYICRKVNHEQTNKEQVQKLDLGTNNTVWMPLKAVWILAVCAVVHLYRFC